MDYNVNYKLYPEEIVSDTEDYLFSDSCPSFDIDRVVFENEECRDLVRQGTYMIISLMISWELSF